MVRNPFNPHQVKKVSLHPRDVDALVFWTRNPDPITPYLDELDSFDPPYYFQITITGLPRILEPMAPDQRSACRRFIELSDRIGPGRVIWRFDPILITDISDDERQIESFTSLCNILQGSTRRVIISFADMYKKVLANLQKIEHRERITFFDIKNDEERMMRLAGRLAEIAMRAGMEIRACCEATDFTHLGIQPSKCIDEEIFNREFGLELKFPRDKNQRENCHCATSVDIGHYDTCLHGCVYCYATRSLDAARKNRLLHNEHSPFLIDPPEEKNPRLF